MLLIECPWCGKREQTEFSCHGEAHIARPEDPDALSDEQWAAYLFLRKNPKGVHYERWMHAFGCRRFFNMARDTVSGEIFGSYPMGGQQPPTSATAPRPEKQGQTASDASASRDAKSSTSAIESPAETGTESQVNSETESDAART